MTDVQRAMLTIRAAKLAQSALDLLLCPNLENAVFQLSSVYGYGRARRVFDYLCRTYRKWDPHYEHFLWLDRAARDAAWELQKLWGFKNGLSFL